jgi:hypothetical protein
MERLNPVEISALNRQFLEEVGSQAGMDKFAEVSRDVTAIKVRESSFWDKIIPPQNITDAECYTDRDTDTFYRLEEIEEDGVAQVLDWRGQPTGEYMQGQRYVVPFNRFSSPRYWKTEQEIRVYKHPITEYIERNSANAIVKLKDGHAISLVDAAVAATGKIVTGAGVDGELLRSDFIQLFNLLDGYELESKKILMRKDDFNMLLNWKSSELDLGAYDVAKDGYTYAKLMGREIITTIKNVFPRGYIYCFTDPEYLGKHYTLNDFKFEMERRFQTVQWELSMEMGTAIGNIYSCALLIVNQAPAEEEEEEGV